MKSLVTNLATAIANGDSATIAKIYPDAVKAPALSALVVKDDSLDIEQTAEGVYTVHFAGGKDAVIEKKGETLQIVKSHNLFVFDPSTMPFYKSVGLLSDSLTDAENAERLSDKAFDAYIAELAMKAVQEKVKIKSVTDTRSTGSSSCTVVVANETDAEIGGDEYTVKATIYTYMAMGMASFDDAISTKKLTGQPIPANGETKYSFAVGMGARGVTDFAKCKLTLNIKPETAKKAIKATGTEYNDYLKQKLPQQ